MHHGRGAFTDSRLASQQEPVQFGKITDGSEAGIGVSVSPVRPPHIPTQEAIGPSPRVWATGCSYGHSMSPYPASLRADRSSWFRELAVLLVGFGVSWLLWLPFAWSPPEGDVMPWNYYAASVGPLVGAGGARCHGGSSLDAYIWTGRGVGLARLADTPSGSTYRLCCVVPGCDGCLVRVARAGVSLQSHIHENGARGHRMGSNPSRGVCMARLAEQVIGVERAAGYRLHAGFDLFVTSDSLPGPLPTVISMIVIVQGVVVAVALAVEIRRKAAEETEFDERAGTPPS